MNVAQMSILDSESANSNVAMYISTGNANGFYTLREVTYNVSNLPVDRYRQNLSRDWTVAYEMARTIAREAGAKLLTRFNEQWNLNEWGSGNTTPKKQGEYYSIKFHLDNGVMPFGKYCGVRLEDLSSEYRNWLRRHAQDTPTGNLLNEYLMPFEPQDVEMDTDMEALEAIAEETVTPEPVVETAVAEPEPVVSKSVHIGTPKERLETELTCIKRVVYHSHYGAGSISVLTDKNGNVFKTFGVCRIEEGDTRKVSFVIKGHDEWKGENQTIITRVALR